MDREGVERARAGGAGAQIAVGIVIALAVVGGLLLFLLNVADSASM